MTASVDWEGQTCVISGYIAVVVVVADAAVIMTMTLVEAIGENR